MLDVHIGEEGILWKSPDVYFATFIQKGPVYRVEWMINPFREYRLRLHMRLIDL